MEIPKVWASPFAIAAAITLLTEWSFIEIVQWISNENSRHLLTATTTILGILGWGWGAMLWLRGRDAVSQLEVLQEKHVMLQQKLDELPDMMTRVFTPYFNVLMRSVRSKLSPKEQHDVFAKLQLTRVQDGIEGVRQTRASIQSPFASPFGLEEGRNPYRAAKRPLGSIRSDEAFDDFPRVDSLAREAARPAKHEPEEKTPLFEDQIRQIVKEGIDRSLKGVGIASPDQPTRRQISP